LAGRDDQATNLYQEQSEEHESLHPETGSRSSVSTRDTFSDDDETLHGTPPAVQCLTTNIYHHSRISKSPTQQLAPLI